MKNTKEHKIKLWKENRLDQEYEMTIKDLVDGFIKSKFNTHIVNRFNSFLVFIASSDADGLNSSMDVPFSRAIEDAIHQELSSRSNEIDYLEEAK